MGVRRAPRWALPVLIAILAMFGVVPLAGQALAAPPAAGTQPLMEFKTANNAGWFYTLSPAEAQTAGQKFGFVWQRPVAKLSPQPGPGTVPLYGLRSVERSSYLVSVAPGELENLAKSGKFVNEGVLGYVSATPAPGLIQLMRFSHEGQWRVGPEFEIAAQQHAGFLLDGPIGWAVPV